MSHSIVADTGGILRALASTADGRPRFLEYENVPASASLVIVPGLFLAEVIFGVSTRKAGLVDIAQAIVKN